jgi:hypothetical protein
MRTTATDEYCVRFLTRASLAFAGEEAQKRSLAEVYQVLR